MNLGTVERKRKRRMTASDGNDFVTETRFRGRTGNGTLSLKDYADREGTHIHVGCHLEANAEVKAKLYGKGKRYDNFVTVDVAAYYPNSELTRMEEISMFMTEEQARALRDSLNALDI